MFEKHTRQKKLFIQQNMADQDQPTQAVDTCSIWLSDLTDNKTTLECGHTFHADCISSWFRSQHVSCPECRGLPTKCMSRKCASMRFRELQKLSRKKNAPKSLVQVFKTYKRKQQQFKLRKAKRRALAKEAKDLAKNPIVKDYLSKRRRSSWQAEFKDRLKMEEEKYLIGCTDYEGVNVRAITDQPLKLAQTIEFENGTRLVIN